jgi:hypothetical protein
MSLENTRAPFASVDIRDFGLALLNLVIAGYPACAHCNQTVILCLPGSMCSGAE